MDIIHTNGSNGSIEREYVLYRIYKLLNGGVSDLNTYIIHLNSTNIAKHTVRNLCRYTQIKGCKVS